ncbi:MAG: glycosyltransferase family 2 protein [Clostridia bacterium]|nr:glycosyltransferase family 2 protein [Clostridia bacterium]
MEKDLISIIIPVYNVEKYLRNCIDSVLAQTYKNIEIILVDDGSPDTCPDICDEYAKKDSRIKVIHQENGGLSDARNTGIEAANGKYITFIDSDDDVSSEYIKYLYELLRKNNTKMSIATHTVVSNQKKTNWGNGYTEKVLTTEECLDRILCDKGFSISAWAKLYSKDLFNGVRFSIGKLNEDNGTTYKLILQCDKIAYGNKSIYNYYKRQNSITTSKFNLRKMDLVELTDKMCDEIDAKYPNLKDSTDKKRITSRFSVLRQMAVSKLNEQEKALEKEIVKYIKQRKTQILKNNKMSKRDKIALITLMMGKGIFAFSWKIYCKLKY